ncbi:MAG: DUF6898 family protein [Alphaproteobacteria bacterium]
MAAGMTESESYIVEFHQLGQVVKVSAVDPVTMIEVSIVGPANAGEETLRHNAVRKLQYVMKKRRADSPDGPGFIV